jgi:co-chaperonin GroES (HSP10)
MMTESAQLELPTISKENLGQVSEAVLEEQIPRPVGYHVLVAMPDVEDTFGDTGIVKTSTTIHHDSILSMVGAVVDMGEQAYSDDERFPTGPWCKVGDYVMFRMNTGTRFKVGNKEFRLMNDDSIEAVVADPRGVKRV